VSDVPGTELLLAPDPTESAEASPHTQIFPSANPDLPPDVSERCWRSHLSWGHVSPDSRIGNTSRILAFMDKKSDSSRRSQDRNRNSERKPPTMGGHVFWWILGLVVLVMLIVSVLSKPTEVKIHYSDFKDLVRQGNPQDNPDASIEVEDTQGLRKHVIRYSDLKVDKVGPEQVTGTVTVHLLEPADPNTKPRSDVRFRTARLGVAGEQSDLEQLLEENGFRFDGADPPSSWRMYAPVLITAGLFVLFLFIMMRRLGGAGSPMAFGRSRGKMYAQEDIGVTFEDVAGIEEAVEELREVVEFLRTPERYQVLGGRIPKGVLLVGPPGTGKTLLAKAIAGEAGVPFFSLSGSDFVEMFVGVGAARVRDMFQQAEAKAPCIIFIDELDALGKTRGSSVVGGHDEREQTLNALLVEMDGFASNSGVIVMAATNRPETLDPALLRPGRFDRHVLVDRPDVRGREAILKVHVQNVKLDDDVNLRDVAALTPGFVGADLANLVNEAALLAARKGKNAASMDEFNEGVERVTAGLEKKQRVMHPDEKQRVAHHESGHALVAFSLPNTDPVHKVSIIPRGIGALGYVLQRPEEDRYLMTQAELESRIQVLVAGTLSEEMFFDDVSTGAQNDLERASEIARSMVMDYGMSRLGRVNFREGSPSNFLPGASEPRERSHSEQTAREIDQEVKRIIDEAIEKTRHILSNRRPALEALAQRLMVKEVIDASELREIVEANSPGMSIVPGTDEQRKRAEEEATAGPEASSDRTAEGGR